jgi:hypothetical protein
VGAKEWTGSPASLRKGYPDGNTYLKAERVPLKGVKSASDTEVCKI